MPAVNSSRGNDDSGFLVIYLCKKCIKKNDGKNIKINKTDARISEIVFLLNVHFVPTRQNAQKTVTNLFFTTDQHCDILINPYLKTNEWTSL